MVFKRGFYFVCLFILSFFSNAQDITFAVQKITLSGIIFKDLKKLTIRFFKSAKLEGVWRLTLLFRCAHTCSSGFNSDEYGGRKKSLSLPLAFWTKSLTA